MRMAWLGAILATSACWTFSAQESRAQAPASIWPRCIAERAGQQLSQAGSVCECSYDRGGTMIGKPPGWRWTCDVMRSDDSSLNLPADRPSTRQSLPYGFSYAPQIGESTQNTFPEAPLSEPYEPPPWMPLSPLDRRLR